MIDFILGVCCGSAIMFVVCWMSYLIRQQQQWIVASKQYQQQQLTYQKHIARLERRLADPLDIGNVVIEPPPAPKTKRT